MLSLLFINLFLISRGGIQGELGRNENEADGTDGLKGRLCMAVEMNRAAPDSSKFFACSPLNDDQLKAYDFPPNTVGVWNLHDCGNNSEFDEMKQSCVEKHTYRRQQANCAVNPSSPGCRRNCQATNFNPQIGGACNWRMSNLQPDPYSQSNFLQCTPQGQSEQPCGQWTKVPCSTGTSFLEPSQICISLNVQQDQAMNCPQGSSPICFCAQQQPITNSCPGQSQCIQNHQVCCQQQSRGFPGVPGALPPPNSNPPIFLMNRESALCPGSSGYPVAACSPQRTCPMGTQCNSQSGLCCPNTPALPNTILLCPDGSRGTQPCGYLNECPDNMGCYQGICCPLFCPEGHTAMGFCSQMANSCPKTSNCFSGACCQQEPVKMPVCPSGQISIQRCMTTQGCPPKFECSNGGCCPVPYCPIGVQAQGRCQTGSSCMGNAICMEGLCCPLPRCPTGIMATRLCLSSKECGQGFECSNGGCCPLPSCPNGLGATQRCQPGGCCCPSDQQCINGVCCPLPMCPGGIISSTVCATMSHCGHGAECVNGGCCPLPLCPSGVQPSQRCSSGNVCSSSQVCENGMCCPPPTCTNGQIAIQLCGQGNMCPIGYVCEGRGCCIEPMPLCPNGGRAAQKCERGRDCPPGYGCTPLGGCCPLSLSPSICPSQYNPICQCTPTSVCPPQTQCSMGTCCAPATYNQVPGGSCQSSSHCNGYNADSSRCMQSLCICVNGAYSNGATCQQSNPILLQQARSACDQYGSPCKFVLSAARRRPIFAPIGNTTDNPLWFNVAKHRKCLSNSTNIDFDADNTCLPNEKCVNGECRPKLWPGEYGCLSNEECSSKCENTFCSPTSDKDSSQCQCQKAFLLYGRCFNPCPEGFYADGAYCKNSDEEAFWKDADRQNNLREALNSGSC